MATISEALRIAFEHHQAGRLEMAEEIYRRILAVEPDHVEALHAAGLAAHQMGRSEMALERIERAVALSPSSAIYRNSLGTVLLHKRRLDEAVACYRRAAELDPAHAQAHNNLRVALQNQGKLEDAAACYQRAVELVPDDAVAHTNLGTAWKQLGQPSRAIACWRRALEARPGHSAAASSLLSTLHFLPEYTPEAIREAHRQWNQVFAEPLRQFIRPHANDRSPERRLRIGYVSPDFRDHVIGRNLLPLLREHDHERFEIVCYADVLTPDDVTERLHRSADVWRSISGLTDQQLSELIRRDSIDVLVDVTLHLNGNRLLALARKPAPVQVTFAGYPGTTGLSAIDYRLTDPYLDPPGLNDSHYCEQSIRLGDTFWCYDPLADGPAVNELPALSNGSVTFGCLNNFCKVNDPVLRLWAQVLRAVDRSRLVLSAPEGSPRRQVLDLLQQKGIERDRVTFFGYQPRLRYLEIYQGIDVGLDTFPYNGHTTSLDSFWMGVPVVTLVGQTVVGRAGLSQLMNLALPELIGETPEQYVRIAVELAGDLPRLAGLRATLRDRMQKSPLTDGPRFARNVEAAYRQMWRRWCAGR